MDTPLARHMAENEISDADFAELIDKDRTLVNRLRRGKVRPTLDMALAIERVTGGAVPMQAWALPPDDAEAA